jgi:hypothetical protein
LSRTVGVVAQYDLFTRALSCRTNANVRQIKGLQVPVPQFSLGDTVGEISARQEYLQRFMARVVRQNRHREILGRRDHSSCVRAPTVVATQSGDNPTHAPTHTCRSRGREDVLKRRVAQEISLPWEPHRLGSSEMKKIALSWRVLVHLRLRMCEIVIMPVWVQEWMECRARISHRSAVAVNQACSSRLRQSTCESPGRS